MAIGVLLQAGFESLTTMIMGLMVPIILLVVIKRFKKGD